MPESNTRTNNSLPEFSGAIEFNHVSEADFPVDETILAGLVSRILGEAGFFHGSISVAIVDDPTIHDLNRKYLQHDYSTDVLSFVLECNEDENWIEGEVIVSCDTAAANARQFNWAPENELTLYVVHGTLHLTGMDDATTALRAAMRDAERHWLASAGIELPGKQDGITDGKIDGQVDGKTEGG